MQIYIKGLLLKAAVLNLWFVTTFDKSLSPKTSTLQLIMLATLQLRSRNENNFIVGVGHQNLRN